MALPKNFTAGGFNLFPENQVLCKEYEQQSPRGVFHGANPMERAFQVFLVQMIAMGLACSLVRYILRPLKQPKFVCNVLAGILVSPYVTGRKGKTLGVFPREEIIMLKIWSYFGLVYFLFLVAVKMDVTAIRRSARSASIIGMSGMVASFLAVLGVLLVLPISGVRKGFFQFLMAVFLSLTRFPNVAHTFEELNILSSELGQLAMSCSTANEIVSWVWIVIRLSYRQNLTKNGSAAFFSAIAFVAFFVFAVRPVVLKLVKRAPPGRPIKESYIVMILILVLLGALAADLIGSLQMGVLIMGLIIPHGPPVGSTLTEKTEFIVMDVITPMFYIVVGSHMELSSIDAMALAQIFLIISVGFVAKFIGVLLAALVCKLRFQHCVLLGLMLNIKGPFDLYSFIRWKSTGEVSTKNFTVLVISNVVQTAVVAPLIDALYNKYVRVRAAGANRVKKSLHATASGAMLNVMCCIHEEVNVIGIMTVLEAMNPSQATPVTAHIVHFSDLVGQSTPMIIPYGNQLRRVKSKRSQHIMNAFEKYLSECNDSLNVMAYRVTAPFRSMHEYICTLARDQLIPLIIVPCHETMMELNPTEAASMRNFNMNVQKYSSCTVGVLVGKTIGHNITRETFKCSVAVIFVGGADDREALSLAIRMSSHPMVSVTVLKLTIRDLYMGDVDLVERKLDTQILEDFKTRSIKNERATYRESVVEDTEHAFIEVGSLKGMHDLVITGCQRQGMDSSFDDEMLDWSENPELGVLGDFISSKEFRSTQTTVLVMQYYGPMMKGSDPEKCEFEGDYLLKGATC